MEKGKKQKSTVKTRKQKAKKQSEQKVHCESKVPLGKILDTVFTYLAREVKGHNNRIR